MDLDKMKLPKVNERKLKSNILQNSLTVELWKAIKTFEVENDYKFDSFEVNNVLLDMVKKNHESYLNCKFGFDRI